MNKEEVIQILWDKFKLIRVESNYTQEEMAELLGISKKTLVQIEKRRIPPSWTATVALCALFRNSEILQNTLGGDPLELIEVIVHFKKFRPINPTLGGKVWWIDILKKEHFRIQQNIISRHYRLLDDENRRWISSFEIEEVQLKLNQLIKQGKS